MQRMRIDMAARYVGAWERESQTIRSSEGTAAGHGFRQISLRCWFCIPKQPMNTQDCVSGWEIGGLLAGIAFACGWGWCIICIIICTTNACTRHYRIFSWIKQVQELFPYPVFTVAQVHAALAHDMHVHV